MPQAYSISAEAIAAERARVGDDLSKMDLSRVIQLDELPLRALGPGDVHLRVLAVSAEHNVDHAATADTLNIAEVRGGKIFPGNSALGEVVAVGGAVKRLRPGDIAITHCNGGPDRFGYPESIWGYDTRDSTGWYGREVVVGEWQLIPAPLECGLNLWEIAALPLRAPTAYHLWRRALGIFRLKVPLEKLYRLNVLGFGGGVSELFLQLAKHEGHRAFFCAGSAPRREALAQQGIEPIDQGAFHRFATADDVRAFNREVRRLTDGVAMHIVCDMMRGPVFAAGLQACAREAVNVSAGWQLSRICEYNSALLSVRQITLDHTHYETIEGCAAATELYGSVFRPTVHHEIYRFQDLPRAMHEMYLNVPTGIPIIRVADEMPARVKSLL